MTVRTHVCKALVLAATGVALSGCLALAVTGAAVGIASTAVKVTAKGVGVVAGAVIPGDSRKNKDDR